MDKQRKFLSEERNLNLGFILRGEILRLNNLDHQYPSHSPFFHPLT
jgi:hypothetical protein